MFWMILILVLNFGISWWNAYAVGKVWSEAKREGGFVRLTAWAGYIMSISGFTMVYSYLLMFLAGYVILPMTKRAALAPDVLDLASNMTFILTAIPIVGSGVIIWIQSLIVFWRRKTIGNAVVAGWNTFAQIRNTILVARELPSAFGKVFNSLTKSNSKDSGIVIIALMIVIVAALGGYFTASAIKKKADSSYDFYLEAKNKAEGTPGATWEQPSFSGRTERGYR